MSIEAMRQALEALEIVARQPVSGETIKAITALRQAIEQAQKQEPVALPCCGYTDASAIKWNPHNQIVQCHNCGQTYTATPQRQPLTDEQADELVRRFARYELLRAVEVAHGIKGEA